MPNKHQLSFSLTVVLEQVVNVYWQSQHLWWQPLQPPPPSLQVLTFCLSHHKDIFTQFIPAEEGLHQIGRASNRILKSKACVQLVAKTSFSFSNASTFCPVFSPARG